MQLSAIFYIVNPPNHLDGQIGSTENGTIRETKMLAAIGNRLYLCSVKHLPVPSSSQTQEKRRPRLKNGASKLSNGASVQMNGALIREKGVKAHEKGGKRDQKLNCQSGTRKLTSRFAHLRVVYHVYLTLLLASYLSLLTSHLYFWVLEVLEV